MTLYSMRCPKCGLVQMQAPKCRSCGAAVSEHSVKIPKPVLSPSSATTEPISQQEGSLVGPASVSGVGRLSFHGSGGSLLGIYIVNLLLAVVTLGVYSFWGRVKVRKYLLGQSEFEGDRFAYHGTGMELFIGFVKAFIIVALIMALNALPVLFKLGKEIRAAANILTFVVFFLFIPIVTVAALRYRWSRVSWRGIRFSFRGRALDYLKLFVGGFFLTLITLGLYYPFFAVRRHGFVISNGYLGNQKFSFDGKGKDLFGSYLIAVLLTLPTAGLYWVWFSAKMASYLFSRTAFGTTRFRYAITGGRLLVFYLGNLLLLLVTLGLGFPWVMVRSIRFVFDNLTLEGPLDLESIRQEAQIASATGEALAGILDVDLGMT